MYPTKSTAPVARLSPTGSANGLHLYNKFFRDNKIDAVYLLAPAANIKDLLSSLITLGYKGAVVTGAYSKEIIPLLDEIDEHAKIIGAVNALQIKDGKTKAYKTDGQGLVNTVAEATSLKGKHVTILGAGKLAREMTLLLPKQGVSTITLYNRTVEKAEKISNGKDICVGGGIDKLVDAEGDIFINCSQVGAEWCDTKDVFPDKLVQAFEVIVDVGFKPGTTPLIQKARKLRKKVALGTRFFAHQGAIAQGYFLEVPISVDKLEKCVIDEFGK